MDIPFHIQLSDGRSLPVRFPAELSAQQLLSELVTDANLAIHPSDAGAWRLHNESSGQELDLSKSLQQNGVGGGTRLQLLPRKKEAEAQRPATSEEPGGSPVLRRCENGHYYDPKKHTKCPFCGVDAIVFGPKSLKIEVLSDEHTRPAGVQVTPSPGVGDDAVTRPLQLVHDMARIDPVVGWLVCVGGPEKGKDYRIRSENNTIGRSKDMYICISGDESISRERHTVITFDPQRNAFHLSPGEGRGLVYLNGEALLAHKQLAPYDKIMLGKTTLLFVPFCGDKFKWE